MAPKPTAGQAARGEPAAPQSEGRIPTRSQVPIRQLESFLHQKGLLAEPSFGFLFDASGELRQTLGQSPGGSFGRELVRLRQLVVTLTTEVDLGMLHDLIVESSQRTLLLQSLDKHLVLALVLQDARNLGKARFVIHKLQQLVMDEAKTATHEGSPSVH